jgi:type IV secretion system protein VirB9
MVGRMKLLASAVCAAALLSGVPAQAAQTPTPSKFDGRIGYVTYNPADVVTINTTAGVATHISLQEGESYVTHAFGDSEAWSFAMERNHVFIKPKADLADTNLILVTDQRTYTFRLVYHASRTADVVYSMSFHYPDVAAKAKAVAAERGAIEAGFASPPANARTNYTMSGAKAIAPVNVWDDGKFTYFKFPENRDLPAIYMVDADGQESIVNRNSVGAASDVVVVQKVNAKWRLRLGQQVLAVFNEDLMGGYDAPIVTNPFAATGTSSPNVERVLKGGVQ